MEFKLPTLSDSTTSWGPAASNSNYFDIPVAPILKIERNPKAVDWIGVTHQGQVSLKTEEKDDFEIVTAKRKKPPQQQQQQRRPNFFQRNQQNQNQRRPETKHTARRSQQWRPRQQQNQTLGHQSSVNIRTHWEIQDTFQMVQLIKAKEVSIPGAEDITYHGNSQAYEKEFDFIAPHSAKLLKDTTKKFYNVSPMNDDVMRDIVMDLAESGKNIIVTTDAVLATLMTAPKSVFSWELSVTKAGTIIFLEWREDDELAGFYTVNETGTGVQVPVDGEDAKDNINSATNLSMEATSLGKKLSQLVLTKERMKVNINAERKKNPFIEEGDDPAGTLFRYRKWTLNEGSADELIVIARCEIDGVLKPNNDLYRIFPVNDYSDSNWKSSLGTSRGAILANFIKTNNAKVARWACMSHLAGADKIKFGFLARSNVGSNASHQLLGIDTKSTLEVATQAGLLVKNMWSVFSMVAKKLFELDDGTFMILKESMKPAITIYSADDAAEEGEEGEESSESEED